MHFLLLGFMSTAKGTKSLYLSDHSIIKGYDYVCYDPECVSDLFDKPASECVEAFGQLKFSDWFDDANTALDYITKIKQNKMHKIVMVGSSMGGWITLAMAMKHPELIKGIILIAPALNFMRPYYLDLYNKCTLDDQKSLDAGKTVIINSSQGEMPLHKKFVESSYEMEIDLQNPINVDVPIRIIHGVQDDSVPYKNSITLMNSLASKDVDILYRKAGDHRLCNQEDLSLLSETLDKIITSLG